MSTTEDLKQNLGTANQKPVPAASQKPKTMLDIVRGKGFQQQLALALPKAMSAERLTRIIMTECRKTPALLNTNPESFYGAILQCASLGLEPGSALGHCYLLPFGNGKAADGRPNAQLIIGYRGMIDLARRSGQIRSLNAYAVHEKDDFSYQLGLSPDIHHVPYSGADRGPMTHVYAVANLMGGGVQFEVMSRAEVEEIRNQSKAGRNGPWVSHFEEMAKKTVVRRLFKMLPVSIEAARAVEIDEKTDRGEAETRQDFVDAIWEDKGADASSLMQDEDGKPEVIEPSN